MFCVGFVWRVFFDEENYVYYSFCFDRAKAIRKSSPEQVIKIKRYRENFWSKFNEDPPGRELFITDAYIFEKYFSFIQKLVKLESKDGYSIKDIEKMVKEK